MGLQSLKKFLEGCQVPEEQVKFVSKHIAELNAIAYKDGYLNAIKANRRRIAYRDLRIKNNLNSFLDFLSDLTHGPKQ